MGRLRGRSGAELRDRLRQAASARAERSGLGGILGFTAAPLARILARGEPHAPDQLLALFAGRSAPSFPPGLDDPSATAAAVREHFPDQAAALLASAERLSVGRFDLMGHADLSFGAPIDWQRDPVARLSAPLHHWSRVPYLNAAIVGDHKVVWELNRHQWLVTLGQAYALTGDERWAREIVRHLGDWLDANPPKLGINWASSLEVAFRAISWLTVLRFLRVSPSLTPSLYGRLLQSLHIHGRHLETYLSTYFSPNTHLTGEAVGLFYIGTLVPGLRAARRWQKLGLSVLESQLPIHVRTDGVYFEQATQYHRYTTEFYLHLVLLAEANGVPLAPHVRPTLERLFEHLLHLSRPDGTIPLLGDDDGGRFMQLDARSPDDIRALLATGAVMFDRDDFAFGARGDLTAMLWLLGSAGLRRFEALQPRPPAILARGFPDGGYYISRDSWDTDAEWLAFDCGPHGVMNGGHAHADALAFELAVGGRPVLVDSGTYTYSGPERNAFRDAAAHNTITVDDLSSSEPGPSAFRWSRTAVAQADRWHASPRGMFVTGSHNGFGSLPSPATHRRGILHLAGDYSIIRDRIESAGAHNVALRFHCAPRLDVHMRGGLTPSRDASASVTARDGDAPILTVSIFGSAGELAIEDGWVSSQYGQREQSRVIVWRQDGVGPQEIVTVLLPTAVADAETRELGDAQGGRGFLVRRSGGEDLLIVGDGGPVSVARVETDASWLWLRRDASGQVLEYVAIDAGYGRLDAEALWPQSEKIAWRASAEMGTTAEPPADQRSR